ncbi:spore coat protein SP96-like [Fundulus heteroclitus]|uniref:spore coat protein SP96-like n=1 Tax=Fundulus heteroclitus TaxID=8078 RepID=UPI00165C1901|nr:spore coat protein SP96-like [Fundulus heteroclitus]
MAEDNTESSQWRESEVADLIHIWKDSSIQTKLEGSYRNRGIFENISREMADRGYKRSWIQCQWKIKSLRAKYKEAKDINKRSGRGRVTCSFYEELDRVLGDKPSIQPLYLVDSCFAGEEPEERSPGPAANTGGSGGSGSSDTGDGMLASPSTPASTSEESSTPRTDDSSFNSSTPSTSSGFLREIKPPSSATVLPGSNAAFTALQSKSTSYSSIPVSCSSRSIQHQASVLSSGFKSTTAVQQCSITFTCHTILL